MNIHFILHESFEGPGAIADWAAARAHRATYTRLYAGESLPNDAQNFDFLIVMGGPQSTSTTQKECAYFNAAAEIALIQHAIKQKKYVLGICLGAQLVGEAYGARAEKSPYKEIGIYPLTLTPAAQHDPVTAAWPQTFPVAHWHGDMPGVPEHAVVLATSAGCPRQIIRFDAGVYGLQCHFEFTTAAVEAMITHNPHDFVNISAQLYQQDQPTLRAYDYAAMNAYLFTFLDTLTRSM